MTGVLLPNTVLGMLRRPYLAKLRRGLPDALDLFVVCANAGLGLESSVERVAKEMRRANRAIALQFDILGYEMRVLPERREALQNLGERTGLEPFRRLGATLIQALRYGTPLSQALRTLAADMRQERLVRFEERTARLPALMVMPMAAFILPVLFIVLAGPSIQQLIAALRGMLQ
jgi:tight adherence protein C